MPKILIAVPNFTLSQLRPPFLFGKAAFSMYTVEGGAGDVIFHIPFPYKKF